MFQAENASSFNRIFVSDDILATAPLSYVFVGKCCPNLTQSLEGISSPLGT